MTARVKIVFYSMYGHIYQLAEAVADGAREIPGTEVELLQVPELVPEEILERSGVKKAREAFAHIPVAAPGVTTVVGQGNGRMPSENELTMARFHGRYIATITQKLASK